MSRNLVTIMLLAALIAFACTASNSQSFPGETNQPAESKEPPLKYTLKIGDKSIAVNEGETVSVEGEFSNPKLTLTAEPHRQFSYRGVSFKYPRAFTFEPVLDDPMSQHWTLSGNDFKIMYFVVKGRLTTDDYMNNLVNHFGRKNCQLVDAAPFKFGKKELVGKRLNVVVARAKIFMDVYQIPTVNGQTKLLVLQDKPQGASDRTAEGKTTLDLLQRSFDLEK